MVELSVSVYNDSKIILVILEKIGLTYLIQPILSMLLQLASLAEPFHHIIYSCDKCERISDFRFRYFECYCYAWNNTPPSLSLVFTQAVGYQIRFTGDISNIFYDRCIWAQSTAGLIFQCQCEIFTDWNIWWLRKGIYIMEWNSWGKTALINKVYIALMQNTKLFTLIELWNLKLCPSNYCHLKDTTEIQNLW